MLIFKFWTNISTDPAAQLYKQAYNQLRKQQVPMVVTLPVLNEVTNRVFKEQWKIWIQQQENLGLIPIYNYKKFHNSNTGLNMMDEINKIVKDKILKQVNIVEKYFSNLEAAALFVAKKIGLADRIIAAIAKEHNYIVFTHDGDFINTDVDVLTANGKILRAKR